MSQQNKANVAELIAKDNERVQGCQNHNKLYDFIFYLVVSTQTSTSLFDT